MKISADEETSPLLGQPPAYHASSPTPPDFNAGNEEEDVVNDEQRDLDKISSKDIWREILGLIRMCKGRH